MDKYYDPEVQILVMVRRIITHWNYDNLNPPFWRLYWNSTPGAVIFHQDRKIALTPEHFVLVPPNTMIKQRLENAPVTHFFSHFFAKAPYNRLHSKIYMFEASPEITAPMAQLHPDEHDYLTADMNFIMSMRALIHWLLAKIPSAKLQPLLVAPEFDKILAYIDNRATQPFSNRAIAASLGISISTLLRIFRRELGISPHEYVQRKRIETACAMLYDQRLSIDQIAAATGFCDRYHFAKTFKTFTGSTPSKLRYQRKHQQPIAST